MAENNQYTISSLLAKIAKVMNFEERPDSDVPMPYKVFKVIMMGNETCKPIMTYERTVKEKFRLLKDFGFISETEIMGVPRVLCYLRELE